MSIITSANTVNAAFNVTSDTTGNLSFQVGSSTTALTINQQGAIGPVTGGTPNYGTSGQLLISSGPNAVPSWGNLSIPTSTTITTPVLTGSKETQVAIVASDINLNLGNYFTKTISTTTTFTVSNTASSGTVSSFILDLTNGGASTVNWFSGVKWAGGTAPTLTTAGRDVLGFFTEDGGTTWNSFVLGKDMK
jgi:hypothetical protein